VNSARLNARYFSPLHLNGEEEEKGGREEEGRKEHHRVLE